MKTLLHLPGSVPETGLGRDAIIEDESGLWLTLKAAEMTRFVRLDANGQLTGTVEQPGSAYPIGVVGGRLYSMNGEAPTGDASKATASLSWRSI